MVLLISIFIILFGLFQVSLTIVFIFILCHSVKWIPNLYELARLAREDKREWPPWVESVTHISHFLMVVNSSVNFYIYCFKHFSFWSRGADGGGSGGGGGSTRRGGVHRSDTMSLTQIDNNYTLSTSASTATSLGSVPRKSSAPMLNNKTRLSSVISL